MSEPKVARDAEERGEGVCRTCLEPIWNEGGTIGGRKRESGWSDRITQGGDSLVCFRARRYRHVPLSDREAAIYDRAIARGADRVNAELGTALAALRAEPFSWTVRLGDPPAAVPIPVGSLVVAQVVEGVELVPVRVLWSPSSRDGR